MNSTLAVLINVPILFLLYIIIYFTQVLSGKRQFYGVSLNSDYFNKKEFKELDKKFKLLLTLGFIIFTISLFICVYIFEAYVSSSILPISGFCVYQFVIFIYIHNKVKTLKQDLSLEISDLELEKTKVILDTDFMNEKNTIVKRYSILFIIPFIITIIVAIYTCTQYNSMPDIIPTHWGFTGEADAFSEKSLGKVLLNVFMSIGVGIIMYVSSVNSLKSRAKLDTNNINESKKSHLSHLNKFAFSFFLVNLGCHLLFINILIAVSSAGNVNPYMIWPATILILVASIYQTYLYYKSPSKSKSALYSVDDNDDNWIFGSIYNNANDPSLFVQKRFGVGWTINIGSGKGKALFILPFILIIFISLVSF